MREMFGYISNVGDLFINEIYYYYDEPQLFSCVNKSSQKYLILLTDMDSHNWLMISISDMRLKLMKSNKISIRDVFLNPETDFLWFIEEKNNELISKTIDPQNIPNEDLPAENEYLDLTDKDASDELPKSKTNIIEMAKNELRDIVDISLEENNSHEHEIDCDVLSKVLINTQEIAYSIAENQDIQNKKTYKGRKEFLRENKLRVTASFAGSFGIRLKSNELCDMFSETPVTPVLKSFAELLEATKGKESFKECLTTHSKKTIIKYRILIKTLVSANTGVNIQGASPSEFTFETKFNTNELTGYLDILNKEIENRQEEKEYLGEPISMNIYRRIFSFKTNDNEYISGTVSEGFDVRSFLTHTTAKIRVIEDIDINTITYEERRKYHLISLEAIN